MVGINKSDFHIRSVTLCESGKIFEDGRDQWNTAGEWKTGRDNSKLHVHPVLCCFSRTYPLSAFQFSYAIFIPLRTGICDMIDRIWACGKP